MPRPIILLLDIFFSLFWISVAVPYQYGSVSFWPPGYGCWYFFDFWSDPDPLSQETDPLTYMNGSSKYSNTGASANILWKTGNYILWETDVYLKGNWTLYPRKTGLLSQGKLDIISSENGTFILRETELHRYISSGKRDFILMKTGLYILWKICDFFGRWTPISEIQYS